VSDAVAPARHGAAVARSRGGSTAIQVLRWIVGLGVLAWVLRANGGWGVVRLPLLFPGAIAVFALQVFFGGAVEAQRLRMLCGASVAPIPFAFSYRLVAVATLFSMAIPGGTGGDVLKLISLADRIPGRRAEFTALLVLDRMIGLTTILLVTLAAAGGAILAGSAPMRFAGIVVMPAMLLLGGVIFVTLASRHGPRSLLLRLVPSRWKRLHGLLSRAFNTADLLRRQPAILFRAVAVSMLGQAFLAVAFAVAAHWLVPGASPFLVPAVAFIGLIVNAIPITPGGIGVGEAAFEGLFQLAGFSGGARLLLFWRLGQIPFAILGAWYFSRSRKSLTEPAVVASVPLPPAP